MNAPTKIQIINGPDGEPAFVLIPYADYVKTHPAEPESPDDVSVPHAVVALMLEQQMTPVRAWRAHLGVTQTDVAAKMGITQSAYAQMEAAPKNRKATREKIAAALGIMPEQLDV
jgi:DNA-binding XRE family transcriptional regulator